MCGENDDMYEKLVEIINHCVGNDIMSADKSDVPFSDLGIDSFIWVNIVVMVERELGVVIPDSKLLYSELDSLEKLANLIQIL